MVMSIGFTLRTLLSDNEKEVRMTIEIHRPELEALIEKRLQSGGFQDVEDVLLQALKSSEPPPAPLNEEMKNKGLVEICAMVRGLAEGVDFSRDPSTDRPIDLS